MTSISQNAYIGKLDDMIDDYNNTILLNNRKEAHSC